MENRKGASLNRAGSKVILIFLMLGLIGFTVTRTLHILLMTMPHGQEYVAYLGLVAFDVGALGWLYYATNAAEGVQQRTLAYGMVFICTAGVIITTTCDMLLVSSENGLTNKLPTDLATVTLWIVILVIAINVVAGILVHLLDPKHQRHMATENAKDRIHSAVHAAIDAKATEMAPQVAELAADYWKQQVLADLVGFIPKISSDKNLTLSAQLPQTKIIEADSSNNNLTATESVPVEKKRRKRVPTGQVGSETMPKS